MRFMEVEVLDPTENELEQGELEMQTTEIEVEEVEADAMDSPPDILEQDFNIDEYKEIDLDEIVESESNERRFEYGGGPQFLDTLA